MAKQRLKNGRQLPFSEKALAREFASANRYHGKVLDGLRTTLYMAKRAGEALIAARKLVPHGNSRGAEGKGWEYELERRFHASPRTARVYIRIAEEWATLQPYVDDGRVFTIEGALELLAHPAPPPEPWPELEFKGSLERRLSDQVALARSRLKRAFTEPLDDWPDDVLLILDGYMTAGLMSAPELFQRIEREITAYLAKRQSELEELEAVIAPAQRRLEAAERRLQRRQNTGTPDEEIEREQEVLDQRFEREVLERLAGRKLTTFQRVVLGYYCPEKASQSFSEA